jgi:membrane protein
MASVKQRLSNALRRARERSALFDHLVTTQSHYSKVHGSAQAGAVTYFGFLSFFPILALAFFAVGLLARVYPHARDNLVTAIDEVLPGMVGTGPGEIGLDSVQSYAGTVGLIGLVGVLYAGLGWLSAMRVALVVVFEEPPQDQPDLVKGYLRDVLTLAVIGVVLLVSVALSGAVTSFNDRILTWVGVDPHSVGPNLVLWLVGHLLGVLATAALLLAMYRLLARPALPRRSLVEGALLGALGFEVLKSLATVLIGHTHDQPAFQAFGVALVLLVWINYFSRLVLYGAAWAGTAARSAPAD